MSKELTYTEVKDHSTKKDLYLVIHDKVYDASSFVDEHPYVFGPIVDLKRPLVVTVLLSRLLAFASDLCD